MTRYGGRVQFSSRISNRRPNRIAEAIRTAEAGGQALTNLSDSNPTHHHLAPPALPESYGAAPRGPLDTRQTLARFLSTEYGREVSAQNLYLLSSTSEAYAWLIKLFCNPGDTIIAPSPGYPLVDELAELESVCVANYHLTWSGSWFIDFGELEHLLDDPANRIRAVVAINPNNPTGSYLNGDDRTHLLRLCRTHDLPLIADEVFFDYPLGPPADRQRLAGEDSVLTFAIDGMSKNLAAPHAKLAWIEASGPRPILDDALERLDIIADAYLPMSQLITDQVPQLLDEMDSQHARVRSRIQHNLDALCRIVAGSTTGTIDVYHPDGGWSALVRFPATIDEDALVISLINDAGITVQPGYFFNLPTPGFVSISLLLEPETFNRGVSALVHTIDARI